MTTSRMLKKSASGVLASLRGSTYRSVRLASSLAVALLDSLFEHPEVILASALYGKFQRHFGINRVFPQPARARMVAQYGAEGREGQGEGSSPNRNVLFLPK